MRTAFILAALASLLLVGVAPAAFGTPPPVSPFQTIHAAPGHAAAGARIAGTARPLRSLTGFTDPLSAALAVGGRVVNLQSDVTEDNAGNGNPDLRPDGNDGGWDWETSGQPYHFENGSYVNLYGPIAAGLVDAAIYTRSPRFATAVGDVFKGISRPGTGLAGRKYYAAWDGGLAQAYCRWAAFSGSTVERDSVRARHDAAVSQGGGMAAICVAVRALRQSQGIEPLWVWDMHTSALDAKALAAAYPASAAGYEAEVDAIAGVILDDINAVYGSPHFEPGNPAQDYYWIDVAGALRVFDASQRTDDDATALSLRNTLVAGIGGDGSWNAQDIQGTAYVVLALNEYGKRHGDAGALAAAAAGNAWLLSVVQPGGVISDMWGEYPEQSAEVASALLSGDAVTPIAPPGCISASNPCVSVPVEYNSGSTGVRGFSVNLTLGGGLALCGAGIVEGSFLNGTGSTQWQVLDNGGGNYTVDCIILGLPCGAVGVGTLFTVNVTGSGGGTGTVTLNTVAVRDCNNDPIAATPGPAASITINTVAPGPVTGLSAAQVKSGNPAGFTTGVRVNYTAPPGAASVEVYRAPFGGYPEYTGAAPAAPGAYPPASPWVRTPLSASGQVDYPGLAMPGASFLSVAGSWTGSNWDTPQTNYAYRMAGTAVGKNNHNVAPGPPSGFPSGSMDPNLSGIQYFQMGKGNTVTITGSFTQPLKAANFTGASYVTVGMINKGWIDYATGASFGYNSGMFNTPTGSANGNAYLLFFRSGAQVRCAMEDRNSGNVSSPDQRNVDSVTTFAIEFQDGFDKTGAVVATGGRMRYALDGGAYGPWDNCAHDFRGQRTTLQLGAYSDAAGAAALASFGDVSMRARDFWHYAAYAKDGCGNVSAASTVTGGTLDYHLGDYSDGLNPGQGNNHVNTADVSLLSTNYGATLLSVDPLAYMDVGPTTSHSVNGRPTPDNRLNFEDLMLVAINFGQVSKPSAPPAPAARDELALELTGEAGLTARLRFSGAGRVQGMSTKLAWNPAVVEPVGCSAGELLERQGGVALSAAPGTVDVALLGTDAALAGEGTLATVSFRRVGPGEPGIGIASVDARDTRNQVVELGSSPAVARPVVTGLRALAPNPFRVSATLEFALAASGNVDLRLYSVDGRLVRTLVSGSRGAGVHRLGWDGTDGRGVRVAPGVYYARLRTAAGDFTRTVTFLK